MALGILTEAAEPAPMAGPTTAADIRVRLRYYPETAAVGRWDIARWDQTSAVWASDLPPFEDVSCNVESIRTSVGRDQPLERFRAGTATVTLWDPAGKWSPWTTAPTTGLYTAIRPGIGLEVLAVVSGVTYPIFAGSVEAITDAWPEPYNTEHRAVFSCVDFLAELAGYDGLEQPAVGAGELSGLRLARICDNAGNTRARAFDAGTVPLQATTLAKNALDEAGLVCDTELGALWCGPDGTLIHRDRNGMVSDPKYTNVQATFGEVPPELCYVDVTLASDTAKIKNVVSIANEGGTAVTRSDTASISLYRSRTYRRFDLIHQDAPQSAVIAQRQLDVYAYAANRVEALMLSPAVHPNLLPTVLSLGLLHRIQLRRRAQGFQVVADLQLQGIDHEITARDWAITYRTFSASAFFSAGRWDVGVWNTALWAY